MSTFYSSEQKDHLCKKAYEAATLLLSNSNNDDVNSDGLYNNKSNDNSN